MSEIIDVPKTPPRTPSKKNDKKRTQEDLGDFDFDMCIGDGMHGTPCEERRVAKEKARARMMIPKRGIPPPNFNSWLAQVPENNTAQQPQQGPALFSSDSSGEKGGKKITKKNRKHRIKHRVSKKKSRKSKKSKKSKKSRKSRKSKKHRKSRRGGMNWPFKRKPKKQEIEMSDEEADDILNQYGFNDPQPHSAKKIDHQSMSQEEKNKVYSGMQKEHERALSQGF